MKKSLLFVLPLVTLVSCSGLNSNPFVYLNEERGIPTIHVNDSEHVTYLMLSPFGSIENYEGVSTKGKVTELFFENTVTLKAAAGTLLPDDTQVKTSVEGASFRGWAFYDEDNENVFPDYYTTVPTKAGLALKAIFDGTVSGGQQPGPGPVDPTGQTITWTVINFPNWIPNDGSTVFAWCWGGDAGGGKWYSISLTHDGTDHNYTNVRGTFVAPDNITGFNMARCVAGTTAPNWTAKGDSAGRVYNKTGDVTIQSGVTQYSSPSWIEYNPQ